ncbi:NADPH-dependent 7-cyano-7-deazaguanine reductase QueF [Aggregicoccus sp. 17bor-14]|uniref:preQ(1) synthase n=1 Tax=Myxococcaceae TaxID=31 RepID=UPI00129C9860|nr:MULTISPECIES: preQ(1) synthase [Myxococcaceae]MBF5042401.1 NADPH-dependent 7-cyano-7-deazaguanine reductase QueF [Simulacricoccus sp. 17bor-14]MRI88173.1 NADPH-dependent 7-cyano-7-deazaguanine reductase QueF [Aggregicoccus sp. 17bor-14]
MPSQRQPQTVTQPTKELQVFPNPNPERDYEITFECPEFTCLCPLTGQPDFASFEIRYVPDQLCVESKSLKLYLWSFRNEGAFHEKVTNDIANHIIEAVDPRHLTIEGTFFVRGGITTLVTVRHDKAGRAASAPRPASAKRRAPVALPGRGRLVKAGR